WWVVLDLSYRARGPARNDKSPSATHHSPLTTMKQEQFLNVIDRDEAERRFRPALDLTPLDAEEIPLGEALGRVLARDVVAAVDVPSFDRSNVDGFAVRAEDTFGATEEHPCLVALTDTVLTPGAAPAQTVRAGTA